MVTILSQSPRYGTPLAEALRSAAAEMRNEDLIRLEERGNRLPTLLTLPMMLFILPAIFLIVGGPAALKLFDEFRHEQARVATLIHVIADSAGKITMDFMVAPLGWPCAWTLQKCERITP